MKKSKKTRCVNCNSTRTEIKRNTTIRIRDIGDQFAPITSITYYCKACLRSFTQHIGGKKAQGARTTTRLLHLVYSLHKQNKTADEIKARIGYYLPPTTIHDYYHIRREQLEALGSFEDVAEKKIKCLENYKKRRAEKCQINTQKKN